MKLLVILCLSIFSLSEGKNFPSYFKKCKELDEDFFKCLTESANIGFPELIKEDKSWTPIILGPFEEEVVNVIKSNVSDGKIFGLENIHFMDIKANLKKKAFNIIFTSPAISFIGNANFDGNVLGLQLKESAPFNVTLYGGIYNFKFKYETFEKDKEQYARITKHALVYNLDRLIVDLKSTDNVRGARANKLFNDNWKVINVLSSSVMSRIFSTAFAEKIGQFLEDIPINSYFE